jgi:hypothetical protein
LHLQCGVESGSCARQFGVMTSLAKQPPTSIEGLPTPLQPSTTHQWLHYNERHCACLLPAQRSHGGPRLWHADTPPRRQQHERRRVRRNDPPATPQRLLDSNRDRHRHGDYRGRKERWRVSRDISRIMRCWRTTGHRMADIESEQESALYS